MLRKCPVCNEDIPPKPLGQVGQLKTYCSVRCRSRAQKKRRGVPAWDEKPRPCKQCGTPFVPKQAHHAYCSSACRRRRENDVRFGEGKGNSNYYRVAFIEERGGTCERCGVPEGLEIHHIVGVAEGGSHKATNLRVLCDRCHEIEDEHNLEVQKARTRHAQRSPTVEEEIEAGGKRPSPELIAEVQRRTGARIGWGGIGGKPPIQKKAKR